MKCKLPLSSLRRSCRKKEGINALKSFSFHILIAPEENRKCDLCDLGNAAIEITFIFHYLFPHVVQVNLCLKLSAEFLDLIYVRCECRLQFSMSADVFLNVHLLHSAPFLLFWKVFIEYPDQDHVVWPLLVSWLALSWWSSVPPTAETLSWTSCFSWFDFLFAFVCSSHSQGNTAGFHMETSAPEPDNPVGAAWIVCI